MTRESFARLAGPTARAMAEAWRLASAGQKEGTLTCPKCGSPVRFTAPVPEKSSGQCAAAGCIRWSN